MPGGDRTGPLGAGPRTGRGLGFCSGNPRPGWTFGPGFGRGLGRGLGRGFGRGLGRGFGRGRCWWWGYSPYGTTAPVMDENTEKNVLEAEATYLKERLAELEKRLAELENK